MAFGAVFASSTKPAARAASCALIKEAKSRLHVAVCAIGGIDESNAAEVIDAGADMVAMISGLFCVDDIEKTARYIAGLFG